jgi:parallel beta-helix repeat protein
VGNDDGIALFESSSNTVTGNTVRENRTGVRVYGRAVSSDSNTFENNEISGSDAYGIYIYDLASKNTFRGNRILSNRDAGIYMDNVNDNVFTGNIIRGNEHGIRLDSAETKRRSTGNHVSDNTIESNRQYGIYSYPPQNANVLEGNTFVGNSLGDIQYTGSGAVDSLEGGSKAGQWLRLGIIVLIVVTVIIGGTIVYRRRKAGS